MNKRIRELRKALGLTLEKFGEHVGVQKSAISKIEKGIANITDQMFKSICREFNVNPDWLRNGQGEMFDKPFSLYNELSENSSPKERVIGALAVMNNEDAEILWKFIISHFSDYSYGKEVKNERED